MQQAIDEAGNIWNVDAQGNPVSFVGNASQQRGGGMQIKPADPTQQFDVQKAQADAIIAQANAAKAGQPELPRGWRMGANGVAELIPGLPAPRDSSNPGLTAEARATASNAYTTLPNLAKGIMDMRDLYRRSLSDRNLLEGYAPNFARPDDAKFNDASGSLSAFVATALGLSGQQFNTPAEQQLFIGSILPKAVDTDDQILSKFKRLDDLLANARIKGSQTLGYSAENDPLSKYPAIQSYDRTRGGREDGRGNPALEYGQRYQYDENGNAYGIVDSDGNWVSAYGSISGPPDGPQGPSGGNSPTNGPNNSGRDTFVGAADAFGRNFANAGTLGLADRLSAGANALLPIDNLFGANNRSMWDGSTFGQAYDANMGLQQQTNSADRQVNPVASFAGDVGGSITGMLGANAALRGFGAGGLVARTGGAAGDVAYGTARGGVEGGTQGALIGGGAALGGNLLGRYAIAPLATSAAGTRVGQVSTEATGRAGNAIVNAGRGLFGRTPLPYRAGVVPAAVTGGERAAMARLPDDLNQQLTDAQAMGLPMALADTSPQLQTLAGSVARKSPDAYAIARETLGARALGQADRAQGQIARNFGPVDNPNEISDQLLRQARDRSRPLYQAFEAEPSRTSATLEELLARPAGRQGVSNARTIAANEGRDPNKMGFGLDDQGEVTLLSNPSPTTLDYAKGGIDDVLEQYRNPITGQLNLDRRGRAIEGLRSDFVSELDSLYPNTYPQARAAYAGPAAERAALHQGKALSSAHPRDIEAAMQTMTPGQREQFKLGQRVSMSDMVDRARFSANPYQNVYGSPVAQQRAAVVFGDEAAAGMRGAYEAEQRMAQTAYDTLGGSPTAMRAAADEAFDTGLPGLVTDAVASYATGSGGQGITQKALTKLVDNARLRGSKKRADQLAPILFNTDPAAVLAAVQALGKKSAARDVYVKRARKTGGIFGSSLGSAGAIPFVQ